MLPFFCFAACLFAFCFAHQCAIFNLLARAARRAPRGRRDAAILIVILVVDQIRRVGEGVIISDMISLCSTPLTGVQLQIRATSLDQTAFSVNSNHV